MRRFSVLFLGLSLASPAFAADMSQPIFGADIPESYIEPARDKFTYVGLRGSISFMDDTDFNIAGPTNIGNIYEDSYSVSLILGHSLPNLYGSFGLRGEIEGGYLSHDIDEHNVGGAIVGGNNAFGKTSAIYGLANLYAEYSVSGFTPYIGAGIGFARVDFDAHGVTEPGIVMSDEDHGLAYQFSTGLAYDLYDRLTVEAGYRYLGVTGIELNAVDNTSNDIDLNTHLLQVGLRSYF